MKKEQTSRDRLKSETALLTNDNYAPLPRGVHDFPDLRREYSVALAYSGKTREELHQLMKCSRSHFERHVCGFVVYPELRIAIEKWIMLQHEAIGKQYKDTLLPSHKTTMERLAKLVRRANQFKGIPNP